MQGEKFQQQLRKYEVSVLSLQKTMAQVKSKKRRYHEHKRKGKKSKKWASQVLSRGYKWASQVLSKDARNGTLGSEIFDDSPAQRL
jgi:bisphosphoglycerate-dependent phosphoglycerate mutase